MSGNGMVHSSSLTPTVVLPRPATPTAAAAAPIFPALLPPTPPRFWVPGRPWPIGCNLAIRSSGSCAIPPTLAAAALWVGLAGLLEWGEVRGDAAPDTAGIGGYFCSRPITSLKLERVKLASKLPGI